MRFDHVERSGSTLSFHMLPDMKLLARTDYDSGDHSANFELDSVAELVLVALDGSTTGTVHGQARIAIDEPANYADMRFNHLSTALGAVVPFTATYMLGSTTFNETLFNGAFDCTADIVVDTSSHPGP
jgi:hypothetical protein